MSFLRNPEANAHGDLMISKGSKTETNQSRFSRPRDDVQSSSTRAKYWFQAGGEFCWVLTVSGALHSLAFGAIFLAIAIETLNRHGQNTSLQALWNLGFGKVRPNAVVNVQPAGILGTLLLANSPQAVFSIIYLAYNNLLTCMLMEDEWQGFGSSRKALRVSSPHGEQRSTFWLQLPHRYAFSLLAVASLSHWLLSQSIFLARIYAYDFDGIEIEQSSIKTCGYSPIAIIFTLIVSSIMCIALGIMAFRRYSGFIPFARHNSMIISAACHPPPNDTNAFYLPVMWGAFIMPNGRQHCTFTSFSVRPAKFEPPVKRRELSADELLKAETANLSTNWLGSGRE